MAERVRRAFKAFTHVAASVFVLSGLAMLLATSGTDYLLIETEPLFGLTNRTFLLVGGLFQLALGGFLFAPVDLFQRVLLTLWAGWCHAAYFAGMIWMKTARPFPAVRLVGWKIGTNDPRIVNFFWKLFIVYLLVGSLAYLVLDWRKRRRSELEMFLNKWKGVREHTATLATPEHPERMLTGQSPAGAVADSPLARKGDSSPKTRLIEFKFACHYCGQHIQCGESYSGRQVNCPACGKLIQVPAESKTNTNQGLADVQYSDPAARGDGRPHG